MAAPSPTKSPAAATRTAPPAAEPGETRLNTATTYIAFALLALFVVVIAALSWMIGVNQPRTVDHRYVVDGREVRFHPGDDPRWAGRDWNDRDWTRLDWSSAPANEGIYWLRFHVRAPAANQSLPTGARITAVGAYDLFWDGTKFVGNGVPGNNREEEKPGRLDTFFTLPESLVGPGDHLVALRVSTYRGGFPTGVPAYFKLDDAVAIQAWKPANALCPVAAAGLMSLLTLVGGFFWLATGRRPALLWLTAMCLASLSKEALQMYRWRYDVPADWYHPLTVAGAWSTGLLAWCLVGFVTAHFAVPGRRWLLLALAPLLFLMARASPMGWSLDADWLLPTAYLAALGPLIWAAGRRRPGAWLMLIGVAMSGAWFLTENLGVDFFAQFFPALVSIIGVFALQLRRERREARQARLTAARLEIELLKKSVQPHFLMNTLTALAQTVEENPARAVKLIRRLAAMAGEKQIPLARELDLCRAHLGVMRARTDIEWKLDAEGVDGTAAVPPALFLTLIENGFSHQRARKGANTFTLRAAAGPNGVRYTFRSPGTVTATPGRAEGGTGLRYVRARLEESFPGAWQLLQSAGKPSST